MTHLQINSICFFFVIVPVPCSYYCILLVIDMLEIAADLWN